MNMMNWKQLLSIKRIRELDGGRPSGVDDHRTPFQSDFDRVIFSEPVKRLQDKTQVFPLEPNDSIRTRLTHSLEVSCVARGMGQRVGRALHRTNPIDVSVEDARSIEDICGTAGLVHDLGNPPFGHFGEDAISAWFETEIGKRAVEPLAKTPQMHDDFTRYEGNARTLRLLCHLQVLSDQYGLNLTAATLAASMKYVVPSFKADKNSKNHSHSKPGYCFSELEFVGLLRADLGVGNARHPLAYLVEAADDCVYSVCDIEDGVEKGIVSFDEVEQLLLEAARKNGLPRDAIESVIKSARDVVDRSSGPTLEGRSHDRALMQMFRVLAIGKIVKSVCEAFIVRHDKILQGEYKGELVADKEAIEALTLVKCAKTVGRSRIYSVRPNVELELRGGHILHGLLDRLWQGFDPETKDSAGGKRYASLVSRSFRSVCEFEHNKAAEQLSDGITSQQTKRYYDLMLLTDYVGGMTDSFARDLYRSLTHG